MFGAKWVAGVPIWLGFAIGRPGFELYTQASRFENQASRISVCVPEALLGTLATSRRFSGKAGLSLTWIPLTGPTQVPRAGAPGRRSLRAVPMQLLVARARVGFEHVQSNAHGLSSGPSQ